MPSNTTGLPYTSDPGWVSIGAVTHRRAPVAWSKAARYGPSQWAVHACFETFDTATMTKPALTATLELTPPPLCTCAFQTNWPVSALMANTQPLLDAAY